MKRKSTLIITLIALFSIFNAVFAQDCDNLIQNAIDLINEAENAFTRGNYAEVQAYLTSAKALLSPCETTTNCDIPVIIDTISQAQLTPSLSEALFAYITDIRGFLQDCTNTSSIQSSFPTAEIVPTLETARMSFVGVTTFVNGVAISPDGFQIATNSSDHTVRLWDINTGAEITQLIHESQDDLGMAVAYSPDGRYLASSDFDGDVLLWDLATNEPRYTWRHDGYVWHVAFNRNGTLLATVGSDNFLRLWNTRNGNQTRALRSSAPLRGLAISPNGRQILTGSEEGEVILWETNSGDKLMTRSEHEASVNAVAFSPDGNRAVSLDATGLMIIWNLSTGEAEQSIQAHNAQAFALLWMPKSNIIVTGADDGRLVLWDGTTGTYLSEQQLSNRYIRAIANTSDETAILIGTDDGTIVLSNLP